MGAFNGHTLLVKPGAQWTPTTNPLSRKKAAAPEVPGYFVRFWRGVEGPPAIAPPGCFRRNRRRLGQQTGGTPSPPIVSKVFALRSHCDAGTSCGPLIGPFVNPYAMRPASPFTPYVWTGSFHLLSFYIAKTFNGKTW